MGTLLGKFPHSHSLTPSHSTSTISLGEAVGYSVQFDHLISDKTRIKYMTDGHLIREIMADPLLERYSVLILDEAHDRSLQTDVLLGLIKKIRKKRNDLRLIISSATLNAQSFLSYFTNEKEEDGIILGLEGRQFPVDIQYLEKPSVDYIEECIQTVLNIEFNESPGDILVFLPGQEEIDQVCREIKDRWDIKEKRGSKELLVLPLYSQLTHKAQMRVFLPTPLHSRKVVVSTNIAETSVTIDGIIYVIDSGFVKVPFYDAISGMESLIIQSTSQAEAIQRSGRAGRIKYGKYFLFQSYTQLPSHLSSHTLFYIGKCFRLYTSSTFDTLSQNPIPEMQRSNLESTVLQLKALGIQDIVHFDFMSPPPAEALIRALELLYALGCIDDECKLTPQFGNILAEFPVNPRLGSMLIHSIESGCTEDILTIVSMLSVQNPFIKQGNSKEAKEKLEACIFEFNHNQSDHLTLLKVYNEWLEGGCKDTWCQEKSIDQRVLKRAREIRSQLRGYIKRLKNVKDFDISTCEGDSETGFFIKRCFLFLFLIHFSFFLVRKCLVSGFFANAARLASNGLYKTVKDGRIVSLHPSSVLYRDNKVK